MWQFFAPLIGISCTDNLKLGVKSGQKEAVAILFPGRGHPAHFNSLGKYPTTITLVENLLRGDAENLGKAMQMSNIHK